MSMAATNGADDQPLSVAKRIVLSLFIVLNLFTVLFMNAPPALGRATAETVDQSLPPDVAYGALYGAWLVRWSAYLVGLDSQWQMFGLQPRFHWWYVIKGRYANGEEVVLPLPMQSERSFGQRFLWDFKDAKIYLNLYRRSDWRQAFAYYLCRQHPEHGGAPILSIVYELHWRAVLPPSEASEKGTHLAPQSYSQILQIVDRP